MPSIAPSPAPPNPATPDLPLWDADHLGQTQTTQLDVGDPAVVSALRDAGFLVATGSPEAAVRTVPIGRHSVSTQTAMERVQRQGPDAAAAHLIRCRAVAPWDPEIALAQCVLAMGVRSPEAAETLAAAHARFPLHDGLARMAQGAGIAAQPVRSRERLEAWLETQAPYISGPILDVGTSPDQRTWQLAIAARETLDSSEQVYDDSQLRPDHVGDVQAMPAIPDGHFGTVICTEVLEHVRRPDLAAAELLRVTRPGGTLIVSVPFLYHFHPCPLDLRRFTHQGLSELVKDAGWHVEELGGIPMPPEAHAHVVAAIELMRGGVPSPKEARDLLAFSNFWVRARKR